MTDSTDTTTATATMDPPPKHRAERGSIWVPLIAMALWIGVVGGVGNAFTILSDWYYNLEQPFFKPEDWAFPAGWGVIYLFTAISAVVAWQNAPSGWARGALSIAYVISAAANIAWSYLFFTLQRPDWAFYEVIVLWITVLALIIESARCNRAAAWLLLPHLAWVTFAGALNAGVVWLNMPFEGITG